ncbi:MAG: hypothetical protein QOI50_3885 [Pseudonocardiales bacterium]|nr:hypothetical protein [Pseudonocardiales bacterium]
MHHPWDAAGTHTDGRLVFRVRGPVSGLVGSDGLDTEWPGQPAGTGQPAGSDQPACRASSDAERLADEKPTGPARDVHDDQDAEAPHQLLSNPPKTGDVATTP